MSLAFDENGRPFIILRDQGAKKRVKGLEAHKVSRQADSAERFESKLSASFRKHPILPRMIPLDQHPGSNHCGHPHVDIPWTKGNGQDACQVSFRLSLHKR